MTRLFDALRKAGTAGPPLAPQPTPLVQPVPPAPARATREAPAVPGDLARRSIVRLHAALDLSPEVTREMTGLRVRLEAVLTRQIPRTVMFLASQGGEGTSTVTHQFARVLAADSRLRILLVDAHGRRPAYTPDGLWRTTRATSAASERRDAFATLPNLELLSVAEVLAAAGGAAPLVLKSILQSLGSGYDWILLDGPPVLESPDAAPLGQAVDGVIVVAQAGRTKRPVLARAVDLANRSGGHVIGIVLNRRRLEIPEFIYRRI